MGDMETKDERGNGVVPSMENDITLFHIEILLWEDGENMTKGKGWLVHLFLSKVSYKF